MLFWGCRRPQCHEQRVFARQHPQRASVYLHAAGRNVEVDIPNGDALVFSDFAVAEDAIVHDCEACGILVANHTGQLWLRHHVVLQADVLDVERGVGIIRGHDHALLSLKVNS